MKFYKENPQKGSSMFIASLTGVMLLSICVASLEVSRSEKIYNKSQSSKVTSRYVAEAGLVRGLDYIDTKYTGGSMDFATMDLEFRDPYSICENDDMKAKDPNGKEVILGTYSATLRLAAPGEVPTTKNLTGLGADACRMLFLKATGEVRDPHSPKGKKTTKMSGLYEMGTSPARVFDYSYFINNWGWFYGNNIICQGNARSNGTFDMGNYRPQIWGKPRFETSGDPDPWSLNGYIDDNKDGKENNQDGGIYAWNQIIGTPSNTGHPSDKYQGLKGSAVPQIRMPNLTNLTMYEEIAKSTNSNITIDGVVVCDGVYGDNESKKNLYLEGTYEKPIVITGTIVVKGDVILRGYYKGQGSIYAARNIYLPQRLLSAVPVSEKQPGTNSEASRENWRERNWAPEDAAMIGLFAREHIVMSDFTSSTWQNNVNNWLNNSQNKSAEDQGSDQIPNTDDSGEDDGKWTVKWVEARDAEGKRIPVTGEDSNKDGIFEPYRIIPANGSGEDTDGDGVYDPTTKLSDFYLSKLDNTSTTSFATGDTNWGGNIPSNVDCYQDITYWNDTTNTPGVGDKYTVKSGSTTKTYNNSQNFPQVDAILYTNHFLGGYISNTGYNYKKDNVSQQGSGDIIFFGAVISRNESIIYNATNLYFYHDERISADSGEKLNLTLPRVWNGMLLTVCIDIE